MSINEVLDKKKILTLNALQMTKWMKTAATATFLNKRSIWLLKLRKLGTWHIENGCQCAVLAVEFHSSRISVWRQVAFGASGLT